MNENRTPTRGDQTRDALIRAAMDVFGRDGFHAASTRSIAEAAGANQALIGYHFGGKEGLYLTVFESIAQQMASRMLPVAASLTERLDTVNANTPGHRELALECLETLLSAMLDMLAQELADGWVRLVMREQQDPTRAFEILWEGVMSRILGLFDRLIGLALDQDPDCGNTRLRAITLFGQVLVFVAARTTTARHMGWEQLGPEHVEAVREQIVLNLRAQLGGGIAS